MYSLTNLFFSDRYGYFNVNFFYKKSNICKIIPYYWKKILRKFNVHLIFLNQLWKKDMLKISAFTSFVCIGVNKMYEIF